MQRMDSLDPSKNKILFKKRVHRPWKSSLLEAPVEESLSVEPAVLPSVSIAEEKEMAEGSQPPLLEGSFLSLPKIETRISVGGFLPAKTYDAAEEKGLNDAAQFIHELKSKEQELLLATHDLKIHHALEQAEKMEQARKQEELARKNAEEKALYALQQAQVAAEKIYKAEQQVYLEKQSRLKEEELRKFLEEKAKTALEEVEQNRLLLQKEEKARAHAELQIHSITKQSRENEKRIQAEAEIRIQEILNSAEAKTEILNQKTALSHLEHQQALEQLQLQAEERLKEAQLSSDQKVALIQEEAHKKIEEAKEQAFFHEKAKLTAQGWIQKHAEAAKQAEADKKAIEEKGSLLRQEWAETQERLQSKIAALTEEGKNLTDKTLSLENQKFRLQEDLSDAFNNIHKMRAVISSERQLRQLLEAKLTHSPIREDEARRKLIENKICALNQVIASKEIEKSKLEEKLLISIESLNKLTIQLDAEKTIKQSLEDNIKQYLQKIQGLEQEKQNEVNARILSEQKLSVLISQNENYEKEKLSYAEIISHANARAHASELHYEKVVSDKNLYAQALEKKNQESTQLLEKKTQWFAQELEKVNQTFSQELEQKNQIFQQQTYLLDTELQKSKQALSLLSHQHAHLLQQKQENQARHELTQQRIKELEVALQAEKLQREEAERLKLEEEKARIAAQEKISQAIEQANKTVLNVLGSFTSPPLTVGT